MRHHILFAFTGLLAAASSFTSAHSSSHSSLEDHSSSSLLKRHGSGGGYSYCARSSDKLVFKDGSCSCKQNPSSSYTKCKAVCNEDGCNILCDDENMVVRDGDCKCKSGFDLHGDKCIKSCGQYEAFDSRSNSCVCAPSCSRNSRNSNRCEPSCGENQEYKNGSCQCKSGFELHNNKCILSCKEYETYDERSKTCVCAPSCSRNSRNNNRCEPSCGDNEEYKNGGCQCVAGFERPSGQSKRHTSGGNNNNNHNNNNKCQPICKRAHEVISGNTCKCETGYRYNSSKQCEAICDASKHEVYSNGQCKCTDGYTKKNGQCKPICEGANEQYQNGKCVCVPGCSRNGQNKCTVTCTGEHQVLGNNNKCVCKSGYKFDNKGVCKPETPECPRYQEWNGYKCVCKPGCTSPGNTCNPPQCRTNEEYNEILKKCVCKDNFERTLWGFCLPSCPGKNTYWNGEKCVCKPGCWKHGNGDDCEPNTPSHRPEPDVKKKAARLAANMPVWSSKHHTRDQDSLFCPDSLSACPIPSLQGGYECVDTTQELENCGGCAVDGEGVDCTAITGVSGVGCLSGKCVVFSCVDGYRLSSAGACVPSLLGRS
ncbi:hypothetical protein P389DRAFT_205291 [Cystobasidium minutum MCA 4210]|uniref:uncharacterized protein n=1 Tax=Cystobasidium minutum MCA 4210 TaxID=1397322 RepID=UPI0034CEDA45|eukprot:jgi/Rhomi1/205291/MIX6120_58_69